MTRKPLIASIMALSLSTLAGATAGAQETIAASGGGHGPGIGVEETLGGFTGATFVYDLERFHIDALFGLQQHSTPGGHNILFGIGARFFFLVHKGDRADLGLGGGLSIVRDDTNNASETNVHIEGAAQIRVWLTSNVNLNAALGLTFVTADTTVLLNGPAINGGPGSGAFGIGGELAGSLGVAYFFR